jgi:hypothetical protein
MIILIAIIVGITLALFQVDATVYVVRPGRSNHAVSETSSFLETRLADLTRHQ